MQDTFEKNHQVDSKKEYQPPAYEQLGSLEEITRGPNGGAIDGIFGAPGGFQTS